MSLGSYASRCGVLIEELQEGWSEDELGDLLTRLGALGIEGWEEWREENCSIVEAFVEATPKQRVGLIKRASSPVLLKIAAIQMIAEAGVILRMADELQSAVGSGYREMASEAGAAYRNLEKRVPAYAPEEWYMQPIRSPWHLALEALFQTRAQA